MTHSLLCLLSLCGFALQSNEILSVLNGRIDLIDLGPCCLLILTMSIIIAINFSLCLSSLCLSVSLLSVSPSLCLPFLCLSSLCLPSLCLYSLSPLRLSLKPCLSTPCYCIVLWFWITSRYIVTLPGVCHYGSSVSVDKWTCCGMVDFSFPCLRLSLSNLQLASIILLPPCGSAWLTIKCHLSHHWDYMELICLWLQYH